MRDNKIDRLSALPNELLDDIFRRVERPRPLIGTLNKRLLPFLLRNFYRKVRIGKWHELELLCQVTEKKPELATFIESLDLFLFMDSFDPIADSKASDSESERYEENPHLELKGQVVAFFHRLTQLKLLTLSCTSWLARLPMEISDSTKFPFSSTLTKLIIKGTFDEGGRQFERPDIHTLLLYPRLAGITLDLIIRGDYLEDDKTEFEQEPSALLPHLTQIDINAPLSKVPSLGPLINSAPSLRSLFLTDYNPDSTLLRLLGRVRTPSTLEHLILGTEHEPFKDSVPTDLLQPLESFTNLQDIEVGFPPIHGLSRALSQLPLENISWSSYEGITTDHLRNALVGPYQVKTLKSLEVYTVWSEGTGESLSGVDWREDIDPEDYGWELPLWRRGFSREGFEEVLELAEQKGVSVDGDALYALEDEDAWERELEAFNARRPVDRT
ncbi:hypothetical protein JCM3765_007002 [Sporobolomyces pararoseus]